MLNPDPTLSLPHISMVSHGHRQGNIWSQLTGTAPSWLQTMRILGVIMSGTQIESAKPTRSVMLTGLTLMRARGSRPEGLCKSSAHSASLHHLHAHCVTVGTGAVGLVPALSLCWNAYCPSRATKNTLEHTMAVFCVEYGNQ